MAQAVSITIRGLKEVNRVLKRMDKKAAIKAIRTAFRKALIPVRDAAREMAPHKSGALQSAVKIMSGRMNRGLIRVRVVVAKKGGKNDQFYGAFQELGWRQGKRRLGDRRKVIDPPKKHYLRRAYQSKGEMAKRSAETLLWYEIEAIMKPNG